jgi:hypothetical protein
VTASSAAIDAAARARARARRNALGVERAAMRFGPEVERDERVAQRTAQSAQSILDMQRFRAAYVADHESVALQFAQRLRQNLLRNVADLAQQALLHIGPSWSAGRISSVHLLAISSSVRRDEQGFIIRW